MMAVLSHESHGQIGLIGGLISGGVEQFPLIGEILGAGWIVMTAVESLERLHPTPSPARWHKAGLGRAVHVPFADVMSRITGIRENLRHGALAGWQHEVVMNHAVLVGVAAGQDAGAVGSANGVGGVGASKADPLLRQAVEVRRPHIGIPGVPEGAPAPLIGQDEQHIGPVLEGSGCRHGGTGQQCSAAHVWHQAVLNSHQRGPLDALRVQRSLSAMVQRQFESVGQQRLEHLIQHAVIVDVLADFGVDLKAVRIQPVGAAEDLVRSDGVGASDASLQGDVFGPDLAVPRIDPRGRVGSRLARSDCRYI